MNETTGTWHYGLIARWWAEFNDVEPDELAYFAGAIERYGQPRLTSGAGPAGSSSRSSRGASTSTA